MWGLTSFSLRKVWICRRLRQVHRRCTLTHELIHLERGPVAPHLQAKEERIVDELAARRLIELHDLIEGLQWSRDPDELADALWVDVPTLNTRMTTLDPVEVAQLEHALEDQWIP
ncbi:MAG: hypothetical protein K2Y33_04720 [Mycolicibacterium frederiksbergense]|nr:hypothetical protein [Mycolicibacterium frederiksbergense]